MKKYIVLILVASLICSSFFIFGEAKKIKANETIEIETIYVSEPIILQNDNYL